MKKILYICTKTIENWDIFTSSARDEPSQNTIDLLLLHEEQNLENVSVSQVSHLYTNNQAAVPKNTQGNISYQNFLEQVFSHDLSVVI